MIRKELKTRFPFEKLAKNRPVVRVLLCIQGDPEKRYAC